MRTAFLTHPDQIGHDNGPFHPERPARLDAIDNALRRDQLWDRLLHLEFAPATVDQLELCHTADLIARIRSLAAEGGGAIDADTHVAAASFEIAKLSAGAALRAVDAVWGGECDNAFVSMRPPGHHAERGRSMGFCLFNNVAIAARYAQRQHGVNRVAIVDWDVHHGNGTQDIFYRDGSVFFFSVHQSPLYPYSGWREERGAGPGMGTTMNIPLPAGQGDEQYANVWDMAGDAVHAFHPQLILVSAGFDAHDRDPLGGMEVTAAGFAHLMRQTRKWADELCENRVVCVLEGGYDLRGLSDSVSAVVHELLRD